MLTNLPRQTLFRFFAHLLIRLLVVTSLPLSIQTYTTLLPVSVSLLGGAHLRHGYTMAGIDRHLDLHYTTISNAARDGSASKKR
jgi:hypothetical protein